MAQFKVVRTQTFIIDLPSVESAEEVTRELRKGAVNLGQEKPVEEIVTSVEVCGDSEHEPENEDDLEHDRPGGVNQAMSAYSRGERQH